ncbi:hypothetical protein SAY87_026496 [Trapa incisa]|uniref:Pectate lyase n=1 Tax=Trapa incisa TaxID=236973 RepID=A0AAN7JLG9_9MYRT|nr:hypothetical protein SAY87_026496 [Trapa incisa]
MTHRLLNSILFTALAALSLVLAAARGPVSVNVIDRCWQSTSGNWRRNRHKLATCSVGFSGKMTRNIGRGTVSYTVTDSTDNPTNPRRGTLRYGVSMVKGGKVWITFQKDMTIKLEKPLLIGSFTAIDGRGANVHIAGGACLTVLKAHDVIIHGLNIHHCRGQPASRVMGPGGKIVVLGPVDGDAIRLITSSKVWVDHNTLSACEDGLLDATLGSTGITISNNRFMNQDKVMLLGHDDTYVQDKNMKVTVVYNHFGPNCNQRMPRVRHGYAHVTNNLYDGWSQYALGGSMDPTIMSEANLFIAPKQNKEVTWRKGYNQRSWSIYSVSDIFENGASFTQTGLKGAAKPSYGPDQRFRVASARSVRAITSSAGALKQ